MAGPGCRWPMWPDGEQADHRYCGRSIAVLGGSYCHEHMRKAYQSRERTQERERPKPRPYRAKATFGNGEGWS